MKKRNMSHKHSEIGHGTKRGSTQNPSNSIPKSKTGSKAVDSGKSKAVASNHHPAIVRNSSNKSLKANEGNRSSLRQRTCNFLKSANTSSSATENQIKVPKTKGTKRIPISRVRKYEIEKQTLLIMDQMISHVKDFTTKERYFDYKKISSNIKSFTIESTDCKKIWEQFKSRLRGQFKEGNEEMRQCRNEWNEDFWTHHYRSYWIRLKIYNKLITHPEIIEDFDRLVDVLKTNYNATVFNELKELNETEEKILPVLSDFDRIVKDSDDYQELINLENTVQILSKEIDSKLFIPKELSKQKIKFKEESEIVNKILSHIYSELETEYDKRVYHPPNLKRLENLERTSEKRDSEITIAKILESEIPESQMTDENNINQSWSSWTDTEIINLLRGVYQYGETKWTEINTNYFFEAKTPHDLSLKWMDIRFQMFRDLEKLNKKHQNPVKRLWWLVAWIKKLELKNGVYNENDEMYRNVKEYYINFKNRIVKSEKKLSASIESLQGGIIKIPLYKPDDENDLDYDDEYNFPLNGPIFKITKHVKRNENPVAKTKNEPEKPELK